MRQRPACLLSRCQNSVRLALRSTLRDEYRGAILQKKLRGAVMPEGEKGQLDLVSLWFAKGEHQADWYRAFEAYGHAMATASMIELLMALMIMKAEVLKLGKRANATTTMNEYQMMQRVLLAATFDRLRIRFLRTYDVSKELKQGLEDAKESRDHLAHGFWSGHIGSLWSERGINIIAAECAQRADHFRQCAQLMRDETGVDVTDYIEMVQNNPDREAIYEGWEALLKEGGFGVESSHS